MIGTRVNASVLVSVMSFSTLLLGSGCDPTAIGMLRKAAGTYTGFVVESSSGTRLMTEVTAECRESKGLTGAQLECAIETIKGQVLGGIPGQVAGPLDETLPIQHWTFQVKPAGPQSVTVSLVGPLVPDSAKHQHLSHLKEGCAQAKAPDSAANEAPARFCYDGTQGSFDTGAAFALVLHKFDPASLPPMVAPASYTVEELLKLTRDRSFDSRLDFEQVLQSRQAVQNAHMAMLPRVSLGDVLSLLTINWQTIVRLVGDFAPFLLPNRWIRTRESEVKLSADRMAWLTMRADSGAIAEGLALSALRDGESLQAIGESLPKLESLRDQYLARERLGLSPPGASDDVLSVIQSLKQTSLAFSGTIQTEYAALSGAAGFLNPKAVKSVIADPAQVFAADAPLTFDFNWIRNTSIQRSLELKQMDYLIRDATLERNARYLDWIDPGSAGGASTGVSFGTVGYIRVAKQQIDLLKLRKQQLQMVLLQRVQQLENDLTQAQKTYALASDSAALEQRRLDRLNFDFRMGIPVSLTELQLVVQNKLKVDLLRISSRYEVEVSVRKISRLVLEGAYVDLRAEADQRDDQEPGQEPEHRRHQRP